MTEAEFRAYAKAEGYGEPEVRSQPPNRFFETHVHADDLIVLIAAGTFGVGYGEETTIFGPGEMCQVASGAAHTDVAGPDGASYILAWRQANAAA
jgi:quercetin dioxygenase-like cupin family protein